MKRKGLPPEVLLALGVVACDSLQPCLSLIETDTAHTDDTDDHTDDTDVGPCLSPEETDTEVTPCLDVADSPTDSDTDLADTDEGAAAAPVEVERAFVRGKLFAMGLLPADVARRLWGDDGTDE